MSLKLIKQKDFALLITGKVVSLLGSNMQQFALSLYVLALTGSATIFASMLAISIIPRLIFSPFAGVFGDWFDRKRSIVFLDFLNALIIGTFAIIYIINGSLTLTSIYILVILLEITEIFFHSAMAAVLPSIVKEKDYLEANTFNSLVMNIGNLLAPVLAALIYGGFGLKIVLIINAISFFLSAISEMFISIPKNHKPPEKISISSFKTDLMEGMKTIKSNRLIASTITLGTTINFCIVPLFSIGIVFIIKEILASSDFQFGLYQMFLSSSMIVAPLICSGYIKKIKVGKLFYQSFMAIALLVLIMALIPFNAFNSNIIPFSLVIVISFMIGLCVTIVNIAMGTLFNKLVPNELMGRTSTVLNLTVTIFIPIGQMISGFLYDIILPNYVIAVSGLILIIAIKKYKAELSMVDEEEEEIIGDMINEF